MDLQLSDKTALVTGSTGGIGLATARTLAEEGARVIVCGRTESSVSRAMQVLEPVSGKVVPLVADLATAEGAAKAMRSFPEVDILVNNLGIYEAVDFFEISDDDWRQMFEVNVWSGVRLSRHYLKGMLERDWGRIVFVSSETGLNPDPGMVHYSATKSVMLAIGRGLAEMTKGTQVTVNSVVPGPTRTEGLETYVKGFYPEDTFEVAEKKFIQEIRPTSLIQRLAKPEEVAATIGFLSSPLGAAINGDAVRVEGGTVRSIA